MVVNCGQAGCGTDSTIHVGDGTARPAHDVVMVVPDPRLVTRHGARRVNAPHQTRDGQCSQHIVDGLVGHVSEVLAHETDDRVGVGVRMLMHRGQDRYPRTRDAQGSPAQHALEFRGRRHARSVPQILESFRIRRGARHARVRSGRSTRRPGNADSTWPGHRSGALGAGLAERLLELRWVRRIPRSRAVRITDTGQRHLRDEFALNLAQTAN
jgi:hypothetical protein